MAARSTLVWEQSGRGPQGCPLALPDVQQLCVDSGFTFRGAGAGLPLARRADLQALFDHFGVTSMSAFRQRFWACELKPGGAGTGKAAATAPLPSSGRSRWQVLKQGGEEYVGETLNGLRHGGGALLTQGASSCVLHVGRFTEGRPNGAGVVATSRGERYEGYFLDGVPWGPGEYLYAAPAAPAGPEAAAAAAGAPQRPAGQQPEQPEQQPGQQEQGAFRVSFRGMMNGRPQGKGCLAWSDGRVQAGQFDGNNCYLRLEEAQLAGVLLVAADNASEARTAAAAVQEEAAQQEARISQASARLLAAVGRPQRPGGRPAQEGDEV